MKKEQGITLISLVVTIIVLIILAGVSINLILGQDGIINKAKEAKQNMELAAAEEATRLNELYGGMIEINDGSPSYDAIAKLVEFKREIASAITDMGVETASNADANTMVNNIKSISGASSADKISYNNTNSGLTSTNLQGAVDELDKQLETEMIIKNITEAVSIPNNEETILTDLIPELSSGIWNVFGWVRFDTNAIGFRKLACVSGGNADLSGGGTVQETTVNAVNGMRTVISFSFTNNANNTSYPRITVRQNSGSNLNVVGARLVAIKIRNH